MWTVELFGEVQNVSEQEVMLLRICFRNVFQAVTFEPLRMHKHMVGVIPVGFVGFFKIVLHVLENGASV